MVAEPGSLLGACDVLLITATDRETTALKAALGAVSSAEPGILHGRRKTYTDHGLVAGTRVVRVRCEMGAGAPGGASSTVADAIHEVAPRAIIMVGIAFGAKGKAKQRLGTILVSQQLQDYELQRVGTDPQGSQKIIPRGDRVSASPRLVDRLRHAKESWLAKEPVEFGLVLSGDKLVDNVDFLATLKDHFPEAIGGEMEGRGLYVEAKDRAEWILVKAVCDWADGDKRKNKARNQKKAAEAAAGFVVHALLQGGFGSGRRQSWRSVSSPSTSSPDREVRGSQPPHLPNGAARVPVPEVAEVRSPKPPPASGRKKRSARSAAGVSTVPPNELRFAVALSFRGGKYRNFVKKVADELARHVGEERVLYDHFHKAEFARSDLGTHLPKLYVDKSDLVVVFVSRAYARSQWCGLEWGRIHDLIFRGQHERVMLVRLDSKTATLAGLPESAGFLDVSTSAERPEDVATEILKRHGQLSAKARGRAKPPGKASRAKRKKTAPGSVESATAGELSTGAGAGPTVVALPISSDPEFWGAAEVETRLAGILASSARLSRSLDRRLMGELSKRDADLELPLRVARRITALGKGLGPAHMLTEACFEAVLAKNADAKGERAIARRLLCEWLPYGFPEVARVAVLRLDDGPSNSRNLEAGSHREHFVEVYMASLDGRACKFTKTRVDLFGGQSVAENMYAAPPGSVQRQSPQALADALVEVVGERFDVRSQDDVRSRFDTEARKGNTPYLVVPATMRPDGFPDGTIKRLNETFEKLHIVVLPESSDTSTTQETDLWTWMLDFLKDDL